MYQRAYATFAEAEASVGDMPGFDSDIGPTLYASRMGKVFPEDYPVLFWLQPIASTLNRVFDFGGHVGLHYYAFKSMLALPAAVQWRVSDVPAVARHGAELAKTKNAPALSFTSGFDGHDGADLFLSSGALQFLPKEALVTALKTCQSRPRHLVLNKLPVVDRPAFATVQDAFVFKAPYQVFSRGELVSGLENLGYRLRDSWENPGHHCLIWRDPEHSVQEFSGFYFERV